MNLVEELATDAVFDHTIRNNNARSFKDMVLSYYSNTEYVRTPHEIRKDQWILFGRVRCHAWMIIPIAVISQFCLGSLYAWSILNKPIDEYVFDNPKANKAQITFYIALGMLGTSGAVFGPWIESHSPRMCAALAAIVFLAGHCTAALGLVCKDIGMLYFGYGFVGGIGLGIGYVTTIDAVIQWYPHSRGFASGLAVSGFGSGAVAFTNLNAELVRAFTVPQAFVMLGAINFVVMMACALLMRPPPPHHNIPGVAVDMMEQSVADMHYPQQRSIQQTIQGKSATVGGKTITVGTNSGEPVLVITLAQALASRDFWLLWVAFFVNLVFGVVIISNLASMTTNVFGSHILAPVTTIVTIEGAFNASGRLLMGWVSDYVGRRRTFLFIIALQITIVTCLLFIIPQKHFWPFVVLVWLATLCYGGGVGVIAATLADMFGASNMSACHGIMLTGWSVAAIGGGLTYTGIVNMLTGSKGYTLDDPFVYVVNQYWILALLVCGWIALAFVRITPSERMFPRVHGQIYCHMFAGRMFRLAKGTEQHGLHDYLFLTATAADAAAGSSSQDESRVGSGNGELNGTAGGHSSARTNVGPLHGSSRLDDISLGPFSGSGLNASKTDMDGLARGAGDNATVSTYLQDSSLLSGNRKKHQQASEAFNYISDPRSINSVDGNETRNSFVQLTCATPPPRRCLRLFGRWRFEMLTREEVSTVWRMYLSCALLASSTSEKGFE
ncbi:hypothetical protein IW140_001921 [Coemansia sp. RSA 1813]|nr:hypothetical protein EV178_006006 [Coemansia sp. RSA 1646]KAJ1767109.1 hypothetical protein LPJ74_005538 [Coemansia sp. RSA 1843]KAJ2089963.1 hypothetical protein IW138_003093 [Coemansia sp. RSA 986]KAJ2215279.1 hypothetical protein EV179_002367 [Coemansia sp. RSA 487]KAJ2570967.1 hypothetical protein IW140_001921 [Coemansia sp. RSA 1813]